MNRTGSKTLNLAIKLLNNKKIFYKNEDDEPLINAIELDKAITAEIIALVEKLKQDLGVDVDSYGAIPAERVREVLDALINSLRREQ